MRGATISSARSGDRRVQVGGRVGGQIRHVDGTDVAALDAINRACPIEADFHFFFDRRPDFFAWPDAVYDRYGYAGFERDGHLAGYAMVAENGGWVGDGQGRWFYLGDARLLPDARGCGVAEQMAAFLVDDLDREVGLGLGLVKRGNRSAERAVDRASVQGFSVHQLGSFDAATLLLLTGLGRPRSCRVRRGRRDDIESLVALMRRAWRGRLFAPDMTEERLEREIGGAWPGMSPDRYFLAERGGRLVGALAAWDLQPVKQTRVLAYPPSARLMRVAHRLARIPLRRIPPLPAPGESFRALHVTRLAIEPRDPAVLRDLLRAVVGDHLGAGYHMVHVGLCGGDPLTPALRRWPVQHFVSQLFAFTRTEERWHRVVARAADPLVDVVLI